MLNAILSAVLPIALVVALGWLAGARRIVPDDAAAVLATFVTRFALPLSLFLAAAAAKASDILDGPYLGALAVGLIGTFTAGGLLARLAFARPAPAAAMQGLTCSFPNMAYCGPPVLTAAVGAGAVLAVVMGNLIVTLIVLPATLVLLNGGAGAGKALRSTVTQPLVLLPVAGAALALAGIRLPELLANSIDEIGRAAGGAALFTLGLILSRATPRLDREIVANVAVKNILQPALILGAGLALGLHGDALKQVFLIGVLPAATAVPTLALAHRTYAETASASVFASTLAALVSIPAGMAIAARC